MMIGLKPSSSALYLALLVVKALQRYAHTSTHRTPTPRSGLCGLGLKMEEFTHNLDDDIYSVCRDIGESDEDIDMDGLEDLSDLDDAFGVGAMASDEDGELPNLNMGNQDQVQFAAHHHPVSDNEGDGSIAMDVDPAHEGQVHYVHNVEAFNKLTERVHPDNTEKFKAALTAAINKKHGCKTLLDTYKDVAQWREVIRYVHFICNPAGNPESTEANRALFYNEQSQHPVGTQSEIYKKSAEGKNVRELHNLYEFNLLLTTMEWMMPGEQWIATQKSGGAGGIRGITNLLSPLEPGNPDGHDYGDTDNYERRRRKDLIERKFPVKERHSKPKSAANIVSPTPKRVRKVKSTAVAAPQPQAVVPVTPPAAPPGDAPLPSPPLTVAPISNEAQARELWFKAAENGDVYTIREMILLSAEANSGRSWRADVNWRDERKITALSKAALSMDVNPRRTETVQVLMQHGADPALSDVCGGCPVYYACCCDQVDILRLLLADSRTKLNVVQEHGTSPLHIAANLGHVDTVELLLTQKDRLRINQHMEKNKRTSLMGAITSQGKYHNRLRIVQLLLNAGCNRNLVDNEGFTAYMLACQRGLRDVATVLWRYQPPMSGGELLQTDAQEVFPLDLHEDTTFAAFREELFKAAVLGDVEEAGRLLYFAQQDHERSDWVDVNHLHGATTLMIVAQLGFELPSQAVAAQMVLRLLCANADPNIPNEFGDFPLFLAASAGLENSLYVMRLLLERRAKVNAQNPRKESAKAGDTAMLAASALGHCDAVQLLVLSGGDPNLPNNAGMLPLMAAAKAGLPTTSMQVVQYLVGTGLVDVNARNKAGETALFLAAQSGHFDIVNYLVFEAGADPGIPNNDDLSAGDAARLAGHNDLPDVLL